MKRPQTLSIRAKLALLVISAIVLAEIVILCLSFWQEATRYASAKKEGLFSTAQVIAAAGARATAQNDLNGAYQVLRAMGRINGLVFAGIERMDGSGLADVGATEQLARDLVLKTTDDAISVPAILRTRTIEVRVPVVFEGQAVGTMRLIADTRDLPGHILAALGGTLVGGAIALVLALLVVMRLQGSITRPLVGLTQAMMKVRADHNYRIALMAESNDEVGVLVEGFNGMIADIRERDARLTRHRERLEHDVAGRTVDFQRAAAQAKAADSAKSDFLATMSHEIRTPMNGILVMAELLAATELPSRARKQAEVIARSGASLLAIINDILDISKIEAGKLDVETLTIDPIEAVDTVLRLFADRAGSKGLDLAAKVSLPRQCLVAADPTRLGQVLSNLVNNALKFTNEGGVSVHIAPEGMERVRFSVLDTGIGIAQDKLGTIFEAFSQADQSTTRQFGGTGLGLAIARKLVSAMGGEIAVTSVEGQGTTFFFSLPLAEEAREAGWARWSAQAEMPRAVIALAEAQTREALCDHLQAGGFDVEVVEQAALAGAATGASLVITGALALGGQPRLASSGVVVLTRPEEDPDTLLRAQLADAPLSWPASRLELDELVLRLIEGRPLAQIEARRTHERTATFTGLRVLVADDAEVNREVADAALQRLGIQAHFVENGREAFEAVMAQRFDLVLMDGSMPVLDGFEATRMIRELEGTEARPRTPVVALTAHVVGTAADAWRAAGMDGVLHKPFTLARLSEIIATHAGVTPEVSGEAAKAEEADGALNIGVLNDLLEMAGGATAVVDRITTLYREQSLERISDLRAAIAANDIDALGKAAHALKSMSFNVGAREVAEDAGRIEREARMEGRLSATAEIDRLSAHREKAMDALDQWRAQAA